MFSEAGGSTLTRHKNVKGKQAFTGVRAPGGLPSFPEPVSRASGTVVIVHFLVQKSQIEVHMDNLKMAILAPLKAFRRLCTPPRPEFWIDFYKIWNIITHIHFKVKPS